MITKIDIKLHVAGQHHHPRFINVQSSNCHSLIVLLVISIVINKYYNYDPFFLEYSDRKISVTIPVVRF